MSPETKPKSRRKKYVRAIGPKLQRLLQALFALFAILGANAAYLGSITLTEWWTGETFQNYFYQYMFLGHLVLGFLLIVPVVVFGFIHWMNSRNRPNRRAVRVGYALFLTSLVLLVTGIFLTRLEGFEIRNPIVREVSYWSHVAAPLVVIWLFVMHRLAGRRIKWKIGLSWLGVAAAVVVPMVLLHSQDPRQWNSIGPASGAQYFFPSLARTATGDFIPARTLMMDRYCLECHADVHGSWSSSVHRFASFNNPAYLFSVRETRQVALERDGDVQASRFCAGCHDLVPFFSGAFDDPDFDDVNHPTAQAGITCSGCHAITNVNSTKGNADFTIEEPSHYPFAFSENAALQWVNRQLVKAKPAFHKKTFLKPLHKTAEFCGACHKVHLPEELNDYKWLRGQNHYDPYLLSGVSGHGASSFYYPPEAVHDCQTCHMPLVESDDFGADYRDDTGELKVHDHLFPSANTAIPYLLGLGDEVIEAHAAFNEGVMRLDLFGLREGGAIDGELLAPLRPALPVLTPGESYLIEAVVRTMKMGHVFPQGTSDSNEIWVDITVREGERILGRSGARGADGEVDPWSHFVNSYVLDREGRRIDRRNAQDIFVPLYSHQIPPGAADVIHYRLDLPSDIRGAVTIDVALRYRKFDTTYMRHFQGDEFEGNDLPILTLAQDSITLPVQDMPGEVPKQSSGIPVWQRWNDYGIGLLRKGDSGANRGELVEAAAAFRRVEAEGRPDGPLNLARVHFKEGDLETAVADLQRAAAHQPPAPPWTVAWFSGLASKELGNLDDAIDSLRSVIEMDTEETRRRQFDFSLDYRVLNELAQAVFESAKTERGEARQAERERLLDEARRYFERTLELDEENLTAHYGLFQVLSLLGEQEEAAAHRLLHVKYKPDDNARDRAVALARRADPAANHAAEAVVIYDLRREGTFGLPASELKR